MNLIIALSALAAGYREQLANVGDAFAIVNALFSSVAVAGAVYAVILQQRELALTRAEMRQAREAHEDSADAQERMALIQGHSTLLADASSELEAARRSRDELRKLSLRVLEFMRTNPVAFGSRNLDGNLQQKADDFFREGEIEGFWTAKNYHQATINTQKAIDFVEYSKSLSGELDARKERTRSALDRKTKIADRLESAMQKPPKG